MNQDEKDGIAGTQREVRTLERDGRPARAVVIERTYDTTVDDVWDAITNPERIPRWFLPVEGDLRLGGRYELKGNASGEVLTCDPPSQLSITWEFGGAISWVDVGLDGDADGGTRLRLEHIALVDDSEHWQQFGPGAVGIGWDLGLLGLAEHLPTGATVSVDGQPVGPPPSAEFMAASSDAWCDADIASGTPEDHARAVAQNTLAAYTGGGESHHDDVSSGEDTGG
jgi:uncharacterized protein YndB with AHSA1/START domain